MTRKKPITLPVAEPVAATPPPPLPAPEWFVNLVKTYGLGAVSDALDELVRERQRQQLRSALVGQSLEQLLDLKAKWLK